MADQISDSKQTASRPSGQTAPAVYGAAGPNSAKKRQFVSFSFYKLLPDFRRLPKEQQATLLDGLVNLVKNHNSGEMILLTYSCVGTRPDVDLMFWKISFELELLQDFSARINRLPLAGYLTTPHSFLAQSKRSTYVDKIDPGHDDARTVLVPGKRKYIFVYPFVKTREWYLLSKPTRQGVMDEHIAVGNKYPSVKLNTTYSFGIDDQEFVVAFETDVPGDFLDLVQELRETEGSRYTLRDTPIFTCVQMPIEELVGELA
jgi:chlorite dismutase